MAQVGFQHVDRRFEIRLRNVKSSEGADDEEKEANLFAAELAGLTGSKLYVGSWSEWIQDASRPVGSFL